MSWWQGVALGLVQGLTEFLPVSSSGHLVLAEEAVGLATPGVVLEVWLHFATLLAVLIAYKDRLLELIMGIWKREKSTARYVGLLVLATVPAGLAGLLLGDAVGQAFDSLMVVGIDFLITGTALWSTRSRVMAAGEPDLKSAGGIGLAQAAAILPGISRSGSTIAAAIWLGVEPVRAAEFSFLMSIPVVLGATILEIPKLGNNGAGFGLGPLALSFGIALITGVASIRFLVSVLRQRWLHRFGPYCWIVGLATLSWALLS